MYVDALSLDALQKCVELALVRVRFQSISLPKLAQLRTLTLTASDMGAISMPSLGSLNARTWVFQ